MNWQTLEQMVEDLDLKSNPDDIIQVRAELKTKIKELHPDITGQFKSEKDSKKLYLLLEALDYCDSERNTLIPLDSVTEIIGKFSKKLDDVNKESIDVRMNRTNLNHQAYIGQRFQLPKISLGAISAILTYIFLTPDVLMKHPYLGGYYEHYNNLFYWGIAVEILAILWFLVWKSETYNKAKTSELFSFDYHREILKKLKNSTEILFSRNQLREEFSSIGKKQFMSIVFHLSLDSTTIDDATNLAIERYLDRKWIRPISGKNTIEDIDDWYEIII
ncbi:MAG: hypothetical protein WA144_05845 [Candidatus Methanoperedens sp.]